MPWVFVGAYLIGAALELVLPWRIPGIYGDGVTVAGFSLLAIGAIVAAWSLVIFRRARTTTTPGEISKELVIRGPYRWTRNPMYVGLTLAYAGETGIMRQLWPLPLLLLTLWYCNATVIPLEESRLRETFGAAYEAYCSRVRRWI